jgi:hypothetical protein
MQVKDPIPRQDAQAVMGHGQALCPYGEIVIRITMEAPVRKAGHDQKSAYPGKFLYLAL